MKVKRLYGSEPEDPNSQMDSDSEDDHFWIDRGRKTMAIAQELQEFMGPDVSEEVQGKLLEAQGHLLAAGKICRQEVANREAARAIHFAEAAFGAILGVVPKRLFNEEIGDAIEFIRQQRQAGRSVVWVYVKVISTIFWVLVNATREVTSAIRGKGSTKRLG